MLFSMSNKLTNTRPKLSILAGMLLSAALSLPGSSLGNVSCAKVHSRASFSPETGIWTSSQTIRMNLKSDFGQIAETIVPLFNPWDFETAEEKSAFTSGNLSLGDRQLPVLVRGNGANSAYIDDVPFPRLKVRISAKATQGTPLEGMRELYINTHLNTEPKARWSPREGRLIDGNSPFREALAYDIAQALGIETGGYRRAWITYEDTKTKKKFERQALLIESHQSVAKRLNSRELDIGEFLNLPKPSAQNLAAAIRVHLFQNLIGHQDFGYDLLRKTSETLKFTPLKNMVALRGPGNKITPVVFDFEMSTLVVGYETLPAWKSEADFGYPDPSFAVTMRSMLKLRTEFYEKDLRPELDFVVSEIPNLQKLIESADVDPEAKVNAQAHLANFRKAASAMYDPSLRFIHGKNVQLYEKPNGRKSLMAISKPSYKRGKLRSGTPFRILEEAGDYLKVVIFDLQFDLEDSTQMIGYIKKDSQFGSEVLQDNLPVIDERDYH